MRFSLRSDDDDDGMMSANTPKAMDDRDSISEHEFIFVSIASYRDSETQWTVKSALDRAKSPTRLVFGICWQYDDADAHGLFEHMPDELFPGQIRQLHLPSSAAGGPSYARHLIQQHLFAGERFILQIDSHTRFRRAFDQLLVQQWVIARRLAPKPILTTYPPGYRSLDHRGQPEADRIFDSDPTPTRLVPSRFDELGMLRIVSKPISSPDRPVSQALWAAGFSFSSGTVVADCPYDPMLIGLFFGEESLMASRLFTSGYDCFAPTSVVLLTKWSRAYRPTFREHVGSGGVADRALARLRYLLEKDDVEADALVDISRYGLGRIRTLAQFEQAAGVNFKNRHIVVDNDDRRLPEDVVGLIRSMAPLARCTNVFES